MKTIIIALLMSAALPAFAYCPIGMTSAQFYQCMEAERQQQEMQARLEELERQSRRRQESQCFRDIYGNLRC